MLHPDARLLCHFSVAILVYKSQITQKNSTELCMRVSYSLILTHLLRSVNKSFRVSVLPVCLEILKRETINV